MSGEPETFQVEFARSGQTVVVTPKTLLLAAARRHAIPAPFSCGQGVCGTCKTRVISGEVEMKHQGGILEEEEADGYILICCSRARSNLVLDR